MVVSCVRGEGHHKQKFLNFVWSSDINPQNEHLLFGWTEVGEPVSELFA